MVKSPFFWPLAIMAVASSLVAGEGLAARATTVPPLLAFSVAAALQSAWLLAFSHRRAWVAGFVALGLVHPLLRDGFASVIAGGTATPLGVEVLLGLLALSLRPAQSWSERLAVWRSSRTAIAAQAALGDGLFPWARAVVAQLLHGHAVRSEHLDHALFAAELEDAERIALAQQHILQRRKEHS